MSEQDDNRRRIKPDLLDEIMDFEGTTFTEQLLNWHRKQDSVSEELERTIESLKSIGDEEGKTVDEIKESHVQDTLSVDDIEDAVSRAIERDLPEVLRREMR